MVSCDNWIGGCYITDFERDGKSSKYMLTLESWTWKIGKDLNKPLTYWIGSKCWKLYDICRRIDWKSMPYQNIMCVDTLFQM